MLIAIVVVRGGSQFWANMLKDMGKQPDFVVQNMNAILVLSIVTIIFARIVTYYVKWGPEKELVVPETLMTVEEFERRVKEGEKLSILDDIVLDIGSFELFHPGGAYVI